jgi:hypothetical protein
MGLGETMKTESELAKDMIELKSILVSMANGIAPNKDDILDLSKEIVYTSNWVRNLDKELQDTYIENQTAKIVAEYIRTLIKC